MEAKPPFFPAGQPGVRLGAGLFLVATAVAAFAAQRTGLSLLRALAVLNLCGAGFALRQALPRGRFALRSWLIVGAAAGVVAWLWWPRAGIHPGATQAMLQLAAIIFAVLAFALHFFVAYGTQLQGREASPELRALLPWGRLLALAQAGVAAVVLGRVYGVVDWLRGAQAVIEAAVWLVLAEALLMAVFRWYQPRRLRDAAGEAGASVMLPALFGEAGPWRLLAGAVDKNLGVRLADAWLVRLGRAMIAPLLLLGALGLWLSTAVTQVPVASRGVLVVGGEFQAESLAPGLHWHAPWPFARIVSVPTEGIRQVSLGFERDLAGPVLWAEKHFEGEQNLLVGGGEELLTMNVPVAYRVRDAVAYLRAAGNAAVALESLGYRQLLAIAGEHTAMGLMTSDRAEVAAKLKAGLQRASDRLGLGLEIVFVGLQDVHPPVPVAPAFQDVVSAEEERNAAIDEARTYAVSALGDAQVRANQTRRQAEAAAAERLALARGQTSRFIAPLAVYAEQPAVFSTRRRLETLEETLSRVRRLWIVPAGTASRRAFFLGLDSPSASNVAAPAADKK